MRISAAEEYGLRCLVQLAKHSCNGGDDCEPLTINEIATREGMTIPNVRKLMMVLREAELVKSVRGRSGGYELIAAADTMTVGQVIEKLSGPLFDQAFCVRHSGEMEACTHTTQCAIRSIWGVLDRLIGGVLYRITLADLATGGAAFGRLLRTQMHETLEETKRWAPGGVPAEDKQSPGTSLPVIP